MAAVPQASRVPRQGCPSRAAAVTAYPQAPLAPVRCRGGPASQRVAFHRCGSPPTQNGALVQRCRPRKASLPEAPPKQPALPPQREGTDAVVKRRPVTAERHTLLCHIRMLWQHHDVPSHHRELYALRYFQEGCSRQSLLQEAAALAAGGAPVQVAEKAVEVREDVLDALVRFRLAHDDCEILKGTEGVCRTLMGLLQSLRMASVHAVEAICAWRRSVAPIAGPAAPEKCSSSTVAGPGARGACWSHAGRNVDYLWAMAHDDLVVRAFNSVMNLSPVCDPFLSYLCGEAATGGKLNLPCISSTQFHRVEAGKMWLLEEEVAALILGRHSESSASTTAPASPIEGSPPTALRAIALDSTPTMLLPSIRPGSARPEKARPTSARVPSGAKEQVQPPMRSAVAFERQKTNASNASSRSISTNEALPLERLQSRQSQIAHNQMLMGSPQVSSPKFVSRRRTIGDFGRTPSIGDVDKVVVVSKDEGSSSVFLNFEDVFRKFADDGNLYLEDAYRALEYANIGVVDMARVEACFRETTTYRTIDFLEFCEFTRLYEMKQQVAFEEQFKRYDADGSGTIEVDELAGLLSSLGIEPMQHVLDEVITEVDKDGDGDVNLQEFYEVMRIVHMREGFVRTEYELFLDAFDKFDSDGSNGIDAGELNRLLAYVGLVVEQVVVDKVIQQVVVDGSGVLSRTFFLVCMRKVRQHVVEHLKGIMLMNDSDNSGTIDADELQGLLWSVGYFPTEKVMAEVGVEVGINTASDELNLSDLWRFLFAFRKREGLSNEDTDSIGRSFSRYSTSYSGTEGLSVLHVGKLLRSLGFASSVEEQQVLWTKFTTQGSAYMSLAEVRKMVRLCREQEVQAAVHMFKEMSNNGALLLIQDAHVAFQKLGLLGLDGQPIQVIGTDVLSNGLADKSKGLAVGIADFVALVCQRHEANRKYFLQNGGLSKKDLSKYRESFEKFDSDGSGDIRQGELVLLIEGLFPSMAQDPVLRPKLLDIINEADEDGNGSLDFQDFLHLVQVCRDQHDAEQLQREQAAISGSQFNSQEVAEFREVFGSLVGDSTISVPFSMLENLVGSIVKLGDRRAAQLTAKMQEIFVQYSFFAASPGSLDFAQFLWLMCWILRSDFADVKEVTKDAASKAKNELKCARRKATMKYRTMSSSESLARASSSLSERTSIPSQASVELHTTLRKQRTFRGSFSVGSHIPLSPEHDEEERGRTQDSSGSRGRTQDSNGSGASQERAHPIRKKTTFVEETLEVLSEGQESPRQMRRGTVRREEQEEALQNLRKLMPRVSPAASPAPSAASSDRDGCG